MKIEFRCSNCKFVLMRADKIDITPELVAYIYGNKCPKCGAKLVEELEIESNSDNNRLRAITIKIPSAIYNRLWEIAAKENDTVSNIIRSAIVYYLYKFYSRHNKIVKVLLER